MPEKAAVNFDVKIVMGKELEVIVKKLKHECIFGSALIVRFLFWLFGSIVY